MGLWLRVWCCTELNKKFIDLNILHRERCFSGLRHSILLRLFDIFPLKKTNSIYLFLRLSKQGEQAEYYSTSREREHSDKDVSQRFVRAIIHGRSV